MKLSVEPIYGWGWYDGNQTIEAPAPFELATKVLEAGEPFHAAVGRYQVNSSHLLAGLWILLSQRHVPSDGQCNLQAFSEEPVMVKNALSVARPLITGYAKVTEI